MQNTVAADFLELNVPLFSPFVMKAAAALNVTVDIEVRKINIATEKIGFYFLVIYQSDTHFLKCSLPAHVRGS